MHDIDWDLLHRYLAGEATLSERERFEAWRDASLERQILVRTLLKATAEPSALPLLTKRDQAETWARLEQTIARERGGVHPARRFTPLQQRPIPVRVAAVIALLLGAAAAGGVLWQARKAASVVATAERTPERVLRTPRGQRATFQLPEGTRVVLGPASTLRYAIDYGQHARDVLLQGEAYFAVTHDARRPFRVHAADLIAQDLGTEFTVRADSEDSRAIVVVREGEVGIRSASATDATVQVVAPGELGRISAQGDPVVQSVELDPYFAWIDGRLVFDGVPLRDALPRLNRWFDLDLRLADSALGSIPVTATFDRRPTADVLANVAAALGLAAVQEGHITYFRRPPSRD